MEIEEIKKIFDAGSMLVRNHSGHEQMLMNEGTFIEMVNNTLQSQQKRIEELERENEMAQENVDCLFQENTELKAKLKEVDNMFLELGAKWHDNEIKITNPALFISSWKRQIGLTTKNKEQ